ncbi:MAG: threonine/serine exporter family protein [Sarcina sp.]
METLIIETICCFLATLAFSIIFNIRGKFVLWASIGGGISWFFYKLLLDSTGSNTLSMFGSAVIFSSYAEIMARRLKTPVTTLVVCGLIPLVPGSGMYYTMSSAVSGNIEQTWALAISTFASAGSLALGVIFTSTITRIIMNFKNKTYQKLKKQRDKLKNKQNSTGC